MNEPEPNDDVKWGEVIFLVIAMTAIGWGVAKLVPIFIANY